MHFRTCALLVLGLAARAAHALPPIYDHVPSTAAEIESDDDTNRWIVRFRESSGDDSTAGLRAMAKMCAEAADEASDGVASTAGHGRRFKGRCLHKKFRNAALATFRADNNAEVGSLAAAFTDDIEYIEKDFKMHAYGAPGSANGEVDIAALDPGLWGLDRIGQRSTNLDGAYNPSLAGAGVHVYVIDTGIRASHDEFGNGTRVGAGFDFVDEDADPTDCNGHGTHCAGTAVGSSYGVAPAATLHGVRVLSCSGSGSLSDVVDGMRWVADNHASLHPGERAVASMSLGGGNSPGIKDAVSYMTQRDVVVVAAAGNSDQDACNYSPANAPDAITVGATSNPGAGATDPRAAYSNYGSCVDIFAPGSSVKSAWWDEDDSHNTISGTSMACPHVAGAAAAYLTIHPTATPAEVSAGIVAAATPNTIGDAEIGRAHV